MVKFFTLIILSVCISIQVEAQNNKTQNNRSDKPPVINVNSCGEMGVEGGWSGWQASVGDYSANAGTNPTASTITYSQVNIAPTTFPTRFVLTGGAGSDVCTPGPNAGSPIITNVAPGFGNASIQLGQLTTNGDDGQCNNGCVERLTYSFVVTKADTNFIYAYAMVFNFRENGGLPSHNAFEVPYAEIYMLDQSGNVVPCSHQKYMGDTTGQTVPTPGLYPTQQGCNGQGVALYKAWTVVGVNLAKYLGQTLTVYAGR